MYVFQDTTGGAVAGDPVLVRAFDPGYCVWEVCGWPDGAEVAPGEDNWAWVVGHWGALSYVHLQCGGIVWGWDSLARDTARGALLP